MTPIEGVRWVLWAGTVGLNSALPDRIAAAAAGGYQLVSMSPVEIAAAGSSIDGLVQRLRDAGVGVVLDPVMGWYTDEPLGAPFHTLPLDDVMRMAETIQAEAISVIGPFDPGDVTAPQLVERFAGLCDRAAAFGSRVQIEFMPLSALGDVNAVWPIVEAAGRENGGIVVDSWHFFRGNPDYAALARVPGDRVFAVQIADADGEVRGDLGEDTFHRKLPGDGQLDLEGLLGALARMGALRWVGPEVISPEVEEMGAARAALVAGERVRAAVAEAFAST